MKVPWRKKTAVKMYPNWLDLLVYRIYFHLWSPILKNNHAIRKEVLKYMMEYEERNSPEKLREKFKVISGGKDS